MTEDGVQWQQDGVQWQAAVLATLNVPNPDSDTSAYLRALPDPDPLIQQMLGVGLQSSALTTKDSEQVAAVADVMLQIRIAVQQIAGRLAELVPPADMERAHESYVRFATSYVFALERMRSGFANRVPFDVAATEAHLQEAMRCYQATIYELLTYAASRSSGRPAA